MTLPHRHLRETPKRQIVKCPWCGEEVSTDEYSRHYETCPKRERTVSKWVPLSPEVLKAAMEFPIPKRYPKGFQLLYIIFVIDPAVVSEADIRQLYDALEPFGHKHVRAPGIAAEYGRFFN